MSAIIAIVVLIFIFVIIPLAARNKLREIRSGRNRYIAGRDCYHCGGWGNRNGTPCVHCGGRPTRRG